MPTRLTMCALLLLLLAAIVNVDAASGQKEIVAETSGIRAKRNGMNLNWPIIRQI